MNRLLGLAFLFVVAALGGCAAVTGGTAGSHATPYSQDGGGERGGGGEGGGAMGM